MKQLSLAALATIICAALLQGDAEDTPSQLVVDTLYGDVPFVRFEPPEEHPIPPEYNHDIPQPQSIGVARSVRVPDQLRPPQQLPAPPSRLPQNSSTFHAWEIPGVRGAYFGISIVPAQSPRPEKILDVQKICPQSLRPTSMSILKNRWSRPPRLSPTSLCRDICALRQHRVSRNLPRT